MDWTTAGAVCGIFPSSLPEEGEHLRDVGNILEFTLGHLEKLPLPFDATKLPANDFALFRFDLLAFTSLPVSISSEIDFSRFPHYIENVNETVSRRQVLSRDASSACFDGS